MKLIKMLGLAMVAAIAAMAFVGASSASAGAITCVLAAGEPANLCPAGYKSYTGPITGLGLGQDTFTSSFVTVKCNGSMSGEISTQGSKTTNAKGTIKSVTWTSCTNNIGCSNTTAKASNLSWGVEALVGSMHISNVLGSFSMECAFLGKVTCIYSASTVLPTLENHSATMEHAMITASKLPLLREAGSSGSCSENGTWSALYDLDPLGLSIFAA
jgi:hypothetical protein